MDLGHESNNKGSIGLIKSREVGECTRKRRGATPRKTRRLPETVKLGTWGRGGEATTSSLPLLGAASRKARGNKQKLPEILTQSLEDSQLQIIVTGIIRPSRSAALEGSETCQPCEVSCVGHQHVLLSISECPRCVGSSRCEARESLEDDLHRV